MDLRPTLAAALGAFAHSLPAVVTPPDDSPVETQAFWLGYKTEEQEVAEFRRSELRRVLVLPRETVPRVPRGTIIAMPEQEGGPVAEWRVDAMDSFQPDHHRVVVVPYEAPAS